MRYNDVVKQVPKTSGGHADRQKLKTGLRESEKLLRQNT